MSPIPRNSDSPVSVQHLTLRHFRVCIEHLSLTWFVEGQVQPFWMDTVDNERLFCWHVLPLDVYLQNEDQLAMGTTTAEVVDGLKGTPGEKLLRSDPEARVVVNFHGVSYTISIVPATIRPLSCESTHTKVFSSSGPTVGFFHTQVLLDRKISNPLVECRPFGTGLAPVDLSFNLWHPTHSPPHLRLSWLRSLHTQQSSSYPHGNRPCYRRGIDPFLYRS